jgi:hypothetical protein
MTWLVPNNGWKIMMPRALLTAVLLTVNAWAQQKQVVVTPDAPKAIGPYSQAIRQVVWCSRRGRFRSTQLPARSPELTQQPKRTAS